MNYYTVTIEDLDTEKKYKVIVEAESRTNELLKSLEKRVAILRAIEDVAYKITDCREDQFIKASHRIYEKSRGYDAFVSNLKTNLNIKAKAKQV